MENDSLKQENAPETSFKKPMLVGKIGKFPKRLQNVESVPSKVEEKQCINEKTEPDSNVPPVHQPVENKKPEVKSLPYEEPNCSSLPESASHDYILEVLKNGSIIETVNVMKKPFWTFGRLTSCDICMQHPTISRYHAVLQYRKDEKDATNSGFYIYDLESTHGTFLNKNRLKPRNYVRMRVGHMLKLGCSTRSYILTGPEHDTEDESALTVTELKHKREEQIRQRELEKLEEEERARKQEEKGIDWGLGEDADEETDLSENPFAQTNNEDLYLENPKKALRGFFEREGLDLEYDCTEQGMGQFLCKVELPIDDEMGRPIFAEVFHKGKKKEAVVQCALEACRILDRHGLLRQATHESRKRKPKNWEENDYYDSDDDTFLDRTGAIEKKREMRIKAKVPQKAETYESLMEKEKEISDCIRKLECELEECQKSLASVGTSSTEADPLDSFMMELKQSKPSKQSVNKLKSELIKLKQEHGNVIKLVNIAKPASLPPLVPEYASNSNSTKLEKKSLPIFGKRKKVKVQVVSKSEPMIVDDGDDEEEEEEEPKREQEKEDSVIAEKEQIADQKEVNVNEKKKRKNQRRIQQKQERAEIEKKKGYDEDAHKEDYNMWVPPSGQSGDGRTSLNDKLGY
ncbi:kanadaptin [Tribolium madens]|uniref:kanadaptin n=1 Tax=Tribolium madens TaxID=41895 RepID=UPI001CF75A36|nr:kanadaptin [Tribolium madens]XP_044262563.1 kanadaptin [Tribolium madens]